MNGQTALKIPNADPPLMNVTKNAELKAHAGLFALSGKVMLPSKLPSVLRKIIATKSRRRQRKRSMKSGQVEDSS